MSIFAGRRQRSVAAMLAVFFVGMTACRDDAVTPRQRVPPINSMTDLGTTIVNVDLRTGQIQSHPLQSGATANATGVSARYFGAPGTISHVFQLEGGAPSASNVFTLDDHIENVFPFAIGTHLPHPMGVFPQDTMGVYVFVSIPPTVTAGCSPGPSCTVVDSADGQYTFTRPKPQPYMFFKTILEAADLAPHKGLDFTDQSPTNGGTGINYFRSLKFYASPGVTNFSFGVSATAAAVKPNDTRWRVWYIADSLPNRVGTGMAVSDLRSEPDWHLHGSAGAILDTSIQLTGAVTGGCPAGAARCFRIKSATPTNMVPADSITYFRSDSLGKTDSAYISADLFIGGTPVPNQPSVFMGMQDRNAKMLIGLSSNKVGFCDASNQFLGPPNAPVTYSATTKNWRVSKFGTDSVTVFADGVKAVTAIYSTLPAAAAPSFPSPFFFFGNRALLASPNPTAVTSLWSDVIYEIGAVKP